MGREQRTLGAYMHRVGRTARGGASGTALSLVAPHELARLQGLVSRQASRALDVLQPLPFNLQQIEGFRSAAANPKP